MSTAVIIFGQNVSTAAIIVFGSIILFVLYAGLSGGPGKSTGSSTDNDDPMSDWDGPG